MKKLLNSFALAGVLAAFAFAPPNTNISQKVIDHFNKTFENVSNVKWFSVHDGYTAVFEQNDIRTIINYNKKGGFLSSRRYYQQQNLPLAILLKIKEKYKGKAIGIVTELIEEDSITYSVNVEDETNVYVLEVTGSSPTISLSSNFKKQAL